MRLVFINRFYWPETPATGQLLTDLAETLAARGHAVTVITSHSGAGVTPRSEVHRGVQIWRVRGTRWAGAGIAGKAIDFASFYAGALLRLLLEAQPGATVVALTDPPLLGIGAWLVARLRGARMVHWVQDIYPELALVLTRHRSPALFRPLRDLAWRRADGCVTLGTDMAATLIGGGFAAQKIAVIPNWAPVGVAALPRAGGRALRESWGLGDRFIIAYSGNLGRVHDLEPVLAVAAALRNDPALAFVFIGEGAQRRRLEEETIRLGLPNVFFRPSQPRARLAEALAVGDVHLVTLLPGCERLVFPSKLIGIAAAGRPALFIGPPICEVARLVEQNDLGIAATRDHPAATARRLQALAADPDACARHAVAGRRFAARHDLASAAANWERAFAQTEACRCPPPY